MHSDICLHVQAALAQAEDRVMLTERHLQQHVEATHKLQVEMEHFKADARQAHQDLSAAHAQAAQVCHVHGGLCSARLTESRRHCCRTAVAVNVDMRHLVH